MKKVELRKHKSRLTKAQVRRFMQNELLNRNSDAWQHGEVNYTRLAEEAAHYFNHDEWLDYESHWVWELALEEGSRAERDRSEPVERSGTGLNTARSPFGPWG